MKFTSQAPLLISCTLPLATVSQQQAGSFPERAATNYSFQQSCPPDFPMPDIWKRQCAGRIDLDSFAPVWLTTCFGWNRPLIYGPVPAENVSGQLQKLAEATPRTRQTSGLKLFGIVAATQESQDSIIVDWDDGHIGHFRPTQRKKSCVPERCKKINNRVNPYFL
jgi:hypothetical protein